MRYFALLFTALVVSQLAACADAPSKARQGAERNQGELSREIDKL